LRFKDIASV